MTAIHPIDADVWFDGVFETAPVMVILRGFEPHRTLQLAQLAWHCGLAAVEVPVQDELSLRALEVTAAAASKFTPTRRAPDGLSPWVGAGTVVSVELAIRVHDAGAQFIVSPGFDPEISTASWDLGMPALPGVATPTEVQRAMAHGHRWLKLFPAVVSGPDLIPVLHGPFPAARFVATGGIDLDNARAFLSRGAAAVSLGSSFAAAPADELRKLSRLTPR